MVNNSSKLNGIQLLRAIAVILVVHCHVLDRQQYRTAHSFQQSFFYLQNFGAVGVDIFFVISGFIITIISSRYAINKKGFHFFIKRVIRVVPLYWLVSLLFIMLYYLHNGKLYNTASIFKTVLFFPFIDNFPLVGPVLFQGWTLSFELIFYIIIAIAMLFGSKRYMPAVVLFFSACMVLNYTIVHHNALLNFLGNGIMLEFLMGVIVGIIFLSDMVINRLGAHILIIAGFTGLLASLFIGYGSISESGNTINGSLSVLRSFIWGLPSALLVAGFAMKEKLQHLHIYSFWVATGNASFSIYLTHIMILQSVYVRWISWGIQNNVSPDLQAFISMAITLAGGYLFYRLIELPLLRWLNAYLNKQAGRALTDKIPE